MLKFWLVLLIIKCNILLLYKLPNPTSVFILNLQKINTRRKRRNLYFKSSLRY